jgi:hypothetical protein
MPDWYDPYPEPNTMPRKWDLSQYGYTDEAGSRPEPTNVTPKTTDVMASILSGA